MAVNIVPRSSSIRPNLESLRNLGNFTQAFRWYVEFENFPALMSGYVSEDINFRAESTGLPKLGGASVDITIRGHKLKQPGIADYGNTIVLTCVETIDNKIAQFVHDWREICWQTEEGGSGRTNYKADIEATLRITRLDNMDNPIWWYKLFGCYLESTEYGDLDGTTGDPFKPALTICWDYFNDGPI